MPGERTRVEAKSQGNAWECRGIQGNAGECQGNMGVSVKCQGNAGE